MAIQFDRKVKCGAEFAALRMIDKCDTLKVGDIWLPQQTMENGRLGFYKVEDIGRKASEETGLVAGDYVLADRLSSFAHTEPVCLMKYDNIICKASSDNTKFYPLRNMVFVKHDKHEDVSNVGGVYVANYDGKLNTGTITALNVDKDLNYEFAVGDKVMLVKGGDIVDLGENRFNIYKHDKLICKFLD